MIPDASAAFFFGFSVSVTLWYITTPYFVQPHSRVKNDLIKLTQIETVRTAASNSDKSILIENWTKWRLFSKSVQDVVLKHSSKSIELREKRSLFSFDWRTEYEIEIDSSTKEILLKFPWAGDMGIYNHFEVSRLEPNSNVIRIIPRFIFGIDIGKVDEMYGVGVDNYPLVGLFTDSPVIDRIIILCYMTLIIIGIFVLVWYKDKQEMAKRKKTLAN